MKTLRIFISSPSDVRAERVRAYDVVQRLQTKFRAYIKIETILWEHEPMRATASFQAQIPKPSESDVVVCVLWARIGMRLPQDYKRGTAQSRLGQNGNLKTHSRPSRRRVRRTSWFIARPRCPRSQ